MSSDSPKVALITGAARRIGAQIVQTLHAQGMNIVLHYRGSTDAANELADKLNAQRPDSVHTLCLDLKQIDELPTLAEQAAQKWGHLDVLVNNASTFYPTPVEEITLQQWDDLIDINTKVPLFLSIACAPYLRESKGCILSQVLGFRCF